MHHFPLTVPSAMDMHTIIPLVAHLKVDVLPVLQHLEYLGDEGQAASRGAVHPAGVEQGALGPL